MCFSGVCGCSRWFIPLPFNTQMFSSATILVIQVEMVAEDIRHVCCVYEWHYPGASFAFLSAYLAFIAFSCLNRIPTHPSWVLISLQKEHDRLSLPTSGFPITTSRSPLWFSYSRIHASVVQFLLPIPGFLHDHGVQSGVVANLFLLSLLGYAEPTRGNTFY